LKSQTLRRLDRPAIESSNERNNAGTGHAALCELNYTVLQPDGSIDIEKAKVINENVDIPVWLNFF
jgi:malate dehydrogenase (quinone)